MSAINGKIIERIVNIPANTAFESFSKFLKLKKYSIGESNTTTKNILLFLFNRFSLIEIQNLGTEQIVILGLQFV